MAVKLAVRRLSDHLVADWESL